MPFLNIPEYILKSNSICLTICTDNRVDATNKIGFGTILPGIATRQNLIESANITAVSEIRISQNQVQESTRMLHFARYQHECSASDRIQYVKQCKRRLALDQRQYEINMSDALKHQHTQENIVLVTVQQNTRESTLKKQHAPDILTAA